MSDSKISQLPSLSKPLSNDILAIVHSLTDYSIPVNVLSAPRTATFVIAASNSKDTAHADYICTGTGDDAIIQAALNALPTSTPSTQGYYAGGGGVIEFLEGTYNLSNPLNITNNNVILRGNGQGPVLFSISASFNNTVITVNGGTSEIWNVLIENIIINGNVTNQTSGTGIAYTNAVQCYLRKVTMLNIFNYCVTYNKSNSQDSYNNWVEDCMFGGQCGGFINEIATETNIYSNNYMFGATGYSGGAYPLSLGGGGATVINNQFGGNSNASNQNAYIRCGNSNPLKVIGNMFNNCSKQWLQLLSGGHSIIGNTFIAGGQLSNNTYNAIEVWDSNNIIAHNVFTAFTNYNAKDIAEQNNNTAGGNVIIGNTFATGITILNPLTKAYGNTGIQDIYPVTAVTVTTNAGTCPVTAGICTFTNSSAATMTITLATANALDGQEMIVRVYDFSAVSETISWVNTENSSVSVPTSSSGSTTLPKIVTFMFNGQTSKWRCIESV